MTPARESRRFYSPGRNQPDIGGETIAAEATAAARAGQAIAAACPYPLWSEAGQHFVHLYRKAVDEQKKVNAA